LLDFQTRSFYIAERDKGLKVGRKENVFYGNLGSSENKNIKLEERAVIAINLFRARN
jgi:hypothetical protein